MYKISCHWYTAFNFIEADLPPYEATIIKYRGHTTDAELARKEDKWLLEPHLTQEQRNGRGVYYQMRHTRMGVHHVYTMQTYDVFANAVYVTK